VDPGIVIPLVLLPIALVGGFLWYRRSMVKLAPDDAKPVSGVRLTAEALHRDARPPWRVVYEVGSALGGVDHVVIGPMGIVAITTVVADRPSPDDLIGTTGEAHLVSQAAVNRGPVDEVARPSGAPCRLWARVYWGSPDPSRPPHDELVHGSHLVEGQRIAEWLETTADAAETPLDTATIDSAWRAVVTGIGRPDPLV
jgi:hypothetical protein